MAAIGRHPKAMLATALAAAMALLMPEAAWANPIADAVDAGVSSVLRDACNMALGFASYIMEGSLDVAYLTAPFDDLFPSVYPVIQNIYFTIAIPAANIVLAVMLVVGLVKVLSDMGRADAGVDIWRIIMVFVAYTFMQVAINSSWALMIGMFDMFRSLIVTVSQVGIDAGAMHAPEIGEDVVGTGWLLLAFLICLLLILVSIAAWGITYGVMLVRCIQVYVMTTFGAFPLAFFVAESGRSIATSFVKRYLALLFSGVIIMLLILMYSAILGVFEPPSEPITDPDTANAFLLSLMGPLVASASYVYCMAKSGAWARDFLGL